MNVTTNPTDLLSGKPANGEWLIQNLGANDIYVARTSAECTTTNGVKIAENEAISIDEPARVFTRTSQLWARTESGTADVRIIRVG